MTKYKMLTNILDKIISQAPEKYSKKYPKLVDSSNEQLNQSRSRAFIHLYLQVQFGLLEFERREHFITDGSYDGGIDGYYINNDNRTIYFIQSKFRTTESNFIEKQISMREILVMDIDRILDGEGSDEDGNSYNGKIKQLQREISQTDNIARYSYRVIILANLKDVKPSILRKLSGGYSSEIFNFIRCFDELVFPMITGTFYTASELNINIDLSNKNAGSKISYTVQTTRGECEITVLFVPTIEIGKIMYQYKNSILKYNPRSYLGHEGKKVNAAIVNTIVSKETNEFALFNNGITMLSDETFINEKIGQKNKARLIVKNPQIINGGQTSYTLSRVYDEYLDRDVEQVFQDKEVLLKIITLLDNKNELDKLSLINEISIATNRQTPVVNADKFANDKLQIALQKRLYEDYGILYERKRGEFADGIRNNYIEKDRVIERNLFIRIWYAANGKITKAKQKKIFIKQEVSYEELVNDSKLSRACFGLVVFKKIREVQGYNTKVRNETYAKVYAAVTLIRPGNLDEFEKCANEAVGIINNQWNGFIQNFKDTKGVKLTKINTKTGEEYHTYRYDYNLWYKSEYFKTDIFNYFEV